MDALLKVYDEKENDWEMEDDYKSIIPEECTGVIGSQMMEAASDGR